MLVVLGPGKFYGSRLPRPRFYAHGDERVDPPVPVSDPLLAWANEAHWSMSGLSFHRHRLQGRIEGSVRRLRAQREEIQQRRTTSPPTISESPFQNGGAEVANREEEPWRGIKSCNHALQSVNGSAERKMKRVRKLEDEFDRIALDLLKVPKEEASTAATRMRNRSFVGEEIELDELEHTTFHKKGIYKKKKRKEVNTKMPRRSSPRSKQ
ncbi:uncharacterized protein LOC141837932 [Curcuma longa]|uniref:uncharacterized protein LOC141837932 n=1 Tax=Curcuma longa TaxID=136217 RepID=UPI003D9E6E1F